MTIQITCKSCKAVSIVKVIELDVPLKKADIFCPFCSTQHVEVIKVKEVK